MLLKLFIVSVIICKISAVKFIDDVHDAGTQLSKNTVVSGTQVVWSPFGVVNVLPLTDEKYENLTGGFREGLRYLEIMDGVNLVRFSIGFTDKVANDSGLETEIYPYPSNISVIEEKFTNLTGLAPEFVNQINPTTKNLYLTSLNVIADWETTFHYRNSRRSRFYLNDTHAVKTKYLKNIGHYKYAELPEIDASGVALKLKNSDDVYFVIIRPDSKSGIEEVSDKLGKANVTELWSKFKMTRVQMSLAKVEVDNQLVFTMNPETQIVNYGSIRLGFSGIESHFSRNTKPPKFSRSKKRTDDVDFRTDRPFIFFVYDAIHTGILNYGEILMPHYYKPEVKLVASKSSISSNAKILSESLNTLGFDLYQYMRITYEKNFVTAPLTLSTSLGGFIKGADDPSQDQLLARLLFPQMWRNATLELTQASYPGSNVTIQNSTKILIKAGKNISPQYREDLKEFDTSIEEVAFRKRNFPGSHLVKNFSTIGAFEYKLNGLVKARKSYKSVFYLNERDSVNATFFEYIGRVKYVTVPFWDAKLFEIPLGVGKQTLLILSPDERSGLSAAENGMKDYPLTELLCQMRGIFMRIKMPRFLVQSDVNILPELKEMGVITPNLKFTRMGQDVDGFEITKLVQNVQVQVGPEIGDASIESRAPKKTKGIKKLILNRPFAFFVYDENAGILALGRVSDPSVGITDEPEVVVPEVSTSTTTDTTTTATSTTSTTTTSSRLAKLRSRSRYYH